MVVAMVGAAKRVVVLMVPRVSIGYFQIISNFHGNEFRHNWPTDSSSVGLRDSSFLPSQIPNPPLESGLGRAI